MKQRIDHEAYPFKIGQNIARIRRENGLTQEDIEQYGISRAYYGRVELGIHSLSVAKLCLIAKAFGVNPSDLFKNEDGYEIL